MSLKKALRNFVSRFIPCVGTKSKPKRRKTRPWLVQDLRNDYELDIIKLFLTKKISFAEMDAMFQNSDLLYKA